MLPVPRQPFPASRSARRSRGARSWRRSVAREAACGRSGARRSAGRVREGCLRRSPVAWQRERCSAGPRCGARIGAGTRVRRRAAALDARTHSKREKREIRPADARTRGRRLASIGRPCSASVRADAASEIPYLCVLPFDPFVCRFSPRSTVRTERQVPRRHEHPRVAVPSRRPARGGGCSRPVADAPGPRR